LKRAWLSWSSGKDSAWALHVLRQMGEVEVVGLLTTFNGAMNRVAMHAVRRSLVEEQARLVGLPLRVLDLPWPCSNDQYQGIMTTSCGLALAEGIECFAFGDLFLEDVRAYREEQLKSTGLQPLFPLWGIPTGELARQMCEARLQAIITCVDPNQLDRNFVGRNWADVKDSFPPGVDACGERGEFHTFAYAGPMFSSEIAAKAGRILERDGFVFADVIAVVTRRAALTDAPVIAELSGQLGYPVSDAEISERLRDYYEDPDHCVLVAEYGDDVVAWVDVSIQSHLQSGKYGEIGGLVVADNFRGQGVGSRLLRAAEEWIKSRYVGKCLVRSRSTRVDAHRFYEREKYSPEKISAVFTKTLT
jgi:uncharacterized protein (TIGR00290 family)